MSAAGDTETQVMGTGVTSDGRWVAGPDGQWRWHQRDGSVWRQGAGGTWVAESGVRGPDGGTVRSATRRVLIALGCITVAVAGLVAVALPSSPVEPLHSGSPAVRGVPAATTPPAALASVWDNSAPATKGPQLVSDYTVPNGVPPSGPGPCPRTTSYGDQTDADAFNYRDTGANSASIHLAERWSMISCDFGYGINGIAFYEAPRARSAACPSPTSVTCLVNPTRNGFLTPQQYGCPAQDASLYAPSVLVDPADPSRFTAVFEVEPGSAPCTFGSANSGSELQFVGAAEGTVGADGRVALSGYRELVSCRDVRATGNACSNLGEPTIHYVGPCPSGTPPNSTVTCVPSAGTSGTAPQIYVTFVDNPPGGLLASFIATWNGNDSSLISQIDQAHPVSIIRISMPLPWTLAGRMDITSQPPVPGAGGDPNFYLVLEAFSGGYSCLAGISNSDTILIARSASIGGPYAVSPTWSTSVHPFPINATQCLGPDMPAWYFDGTAFHVVSSDVGALNGMFDFQLRDWDL